MVSRRHLLKLSALGTASFAAPLAYSASNTTMTHNTGNPIGSTSPKDLSDNARNLDYLCLGPGQTYLDRKGVPRKSWSGMESEHSADQARRECEFGEGQSMRAERFDRFMASSGYSSIGDYGVGLLIEHYSQYFMKDGQPYRLSSIASVPYTTTGDWSTESDAFVLLGDDVLRQSLAQNKGAGMVGWKRGGTSKQVETTGDMLSLQAINPWEFSHLVAVKPNPIDPSTWDWTPALLAAAAAGPVIAGNGATFRIANTVITSRVLLSNITFKPAHSVTGGVLLTIGGDDSHVEVYIDADGKGIGCFEAKGNRVTGSVYASNVTGQPQATGGTQGALKVSGTDCNMFVHAENLLLGTSTNTSIPRLVTTDNTVLTATRNTIRAVGKNVQCGWVTTQDEVHCESLIIDGVSDNGIYHLQGKATAATVRIRHCHDEPVVAKAGLQIDALTTIDCHGFSSMSNATFTVNDYKIISTDPSKQFQPLTVRADNGSSAISIGRLSGNIYLVKNPTLGGIFQLAAGKVSFMSIGEVDLDVHYLEGSTKILGNLSVVEGLNINRLAIRLIDETGTLTAADKFDLRILEALSKMSAIGNVFNNSNSGEVRVANVLQPLLQLPQGVEVSVNYGPYILQESTEFPTPPRVVSTGVPTVGTWPKGAKIEVKSSAIGVVTSYRCTTAGTPGTWRAAEWITGRGMTRPILTANDTGVNFMDTSLVAGTGKPIWWTGTGWVDATGTSV